MRISVKSDAKAYSKELRRFQRKQMPFATMRAINDTLFDIKKRVVPRTFRAAFRDGRNRGFLNGATMRVKKANKQTLTGKLYDSQALSYLEEQHEEGKPRRPRGQHIAVPQHGRGKIRRTARGVPQGQRPRQILQKPDVFVAKGKTGNEAIWQKKKNKLLMLYTLVPTVKVTPRLRFYRNVEKAARGMFPKKLDRAFKKAWDSRR